MLRLPDTWIAHLECGASLRMAARAADGLPQMHRAVAARQLADGRIEVLVPRQMGTRVLDAVQTSGQVALSAGRPGSGTALQVKGRDATVTPAGRAHQAVFDRQSQAFADGVAVFGFAREKMMRLWFGLDWRTLDCVRFTPHGAWDQTPGIGAGGSIELVDAPMPAWVTAQAGDADALPEQAGDPQPAPDAAGDAVPPATTLREFRTVLDGLVPPSMATVSADGVPHVTFLSHAEYLDPDHLALTYQFFNRSRNNLMATGRAALMVECPYSGARVVMQLRYLRTETAGPVFERLRAKLAGIAAHTGMEQVFRLLGADVFAVESLGRNDNSTDPPGPPQAFNVNEGARRLAGQLAEVDELARLVPVFMQGVQQQLHIDHAILWLLDAQRQCLTVLASQGYASSGVGSELALADAGLAGVAVREGVPIRIGHMAQMYRYGLAWRERAEGVGLQAVIARAIPLPGLDTPGGQMAVPLRARGRCVGVLLVESSLAERAFSYDDEDALALLGGQLAQAMAALQSAEIHAGAAVRGLAAPGPTVPQAQAAAAPPLAHPAPDSPALPADAAPALLLRHWPRDHTVFAGDDYLIKGVAGAILWRLATEQVQRGRVDFSTRELRLAGGDLGLPDVQDNLGVRLLLLERRLAERDHGLGIVRIARGRFRFVSTRPLQLQEETGG